VRSPLGDDCRVLVVGATGGLGLEFVRQLLERGCEVFAGHRPGSEDRLAPVIGAPGLQPLPLDVANEASVAGAAAMLQARFGGAPCLTHIINAAGIVDYEGWELWSVDKATMLRVLEVNTVGPMLVAKYLVPWMAARQGGALPPVLAFLSSRTGSVAENGSGGGYAYRASQAALNAVAASLATDLQGRAVLALLHPGFVRTPMTRWQGPVSAQKSVAGMLRAIEATDGRTEFRWVDYMGEIMPW